MSQTSDTHTPKSAAPDRKERFLGCLLGGAVGDALGAPVKSMRRSEILNRFGPEGITNYAPAFGGLGTITSNTQMTLFTAEGLIDTQERVSEKGIGIGAVYSLVHRAYLRWLWTQGHHLVEEEAGVSIFHFHARLIKQQALHSRRAPSAACLAALKESSANNMLCLHSKERGGAVRAAPVGLIFDPKQPNRVFSLGCGLAGLTHGHPTGTLPAGVFAALIHELAGGASLQAGLTAAKEILREHENHEETLNAIEKAQQFAFFKLPRDEAIPKLGTGWAAEEALAIAVYCALAADGFRQGVLWAVNHDGDSDATGSMAGNLLGAMYGAGAIPPKWLEPLELREVIAEMAENLYSCRSRDYLGS